MMCSWNLDSILLTNISIILICLYFLTSDYIRTNIHHRILAHLRVKFTSTTSCCHASCHVPFLVPSTGAWCSTLSAIAYVMADCQHHLGSPATYDRSSSRRKCWLYPWRNLRHVRRWLRSATLSQAALQIKWTCWVCCI